MMWPPENRPLGGSIISLEALPATHEGIFRDHMLIAGVGRRDSAYYSIVDSEWPEVRTNLDPRLAREPARA